MRILCVDDSKSIHAFLRLCLKPVSQEIQSVYDGEEAISLLKEKGDSAFDLIILDWEMPKKSGPEVLQDLKKMKSKIPVIMLTSKNEAQDIKNMLDLGAAEYVLKPFTQEIILEKISFVVGGV